MPFRSVATADFGASGGQTNISCPRPSGLATNDVIIFYLYVTGGSNLPTVTSPDAATGTQARSRQNRVATFSTIVFSRVVSDISLEPTAYLFEWGTYVAARGGIQAIAYSGIDNADPINAEAYPSTGNSAFVRISSLSVVNGAELVTFAAFVAGSGPITATAPSPWADLLNPFIVSTGGSRGAICSARRTATVAGSTGVQDWTLSSATGWLAGTLALRPSSGISVSSEAASNAIAETSGSPVIAIAITAQSIAVSESIGQPTVAIASTAQSGAFAEAIAFAVADAGITIDSIAFSDVISQTIAQPALEISSTTEFGAFAESTGLATVAIASTAQSGAASQTIGFATITITPTPSDASAKSSAIAGTQGSGLIEIDLLGVSRSIAAAKGQSAITLSSSARSDGMGATFGSGVTGDIIDSFAVSGGMAGTAAIAVISIALQANSACAAATQGAIAVYLDSQIVSSGVSGTQAAIAVDFSTAALSQSGSSAISAIAVDFAAFGLSAAGGRVFAAAAADLMLNLLAISSAISGSYAGTVLLVSLGGISNAIGKTVGNLALGAIDDPPAKRRIIVPKSRRVS